MQIGAQLFKGFSLQILEKPFHGPLDIIALRPRQCSADLLLFRIQALPHGIQMKDIRIVVEGLLCMGAAGRDRRKDQNKQQNAQRKDAAVFIRESTEGTATAAAQSRPAVSIADASAFCEASRHRPAPKRLTAAIPRHLRIG